MDARGLTSSLVEYCPSLPVACFCIEVRRLDVP